MTILEAVQALSGKGVVTRDSYPAEFQVKDFPSLAGRGHVSILGNNQAFFFVKNNNPKGSADPSQIQPNTAGLKDLMKNVMANGTHFHFKLDADVMKNPERFVEKYYRMRPEAEDASKKAMLMREAQLIGNFINSGGVEKLAQEVIRENNPGMDEKNVESRADDFLRGYFKVEGVHTKKPLTCATWRVESPQGTFVARQLYTESKPANLRPWSILVEKVKNFFHPPSQISRENTARPWLLALEDEARLHIGRKDEPHDSPQSMSSRILLGAVSDMNHMRCENLPPTQQHILPFKLDKLMQKIGLGNLVGMGQSMGLSSP